MAQCSEVDNRLKKKMKFMRDKKDREDVVILNSSEVEAIANSIIFLINRVNELEESCNELDTRIDKLDPAPEYRTSDKKPKFKTSDEDSSYLPFLH